MVDVEVTTRKWGNSLGITLPKELVAAEKLKANQKIIVRIEHKADITKIKGLGTFKKSAQQLKDAMRTGWE